MQIIKHHVKNVQISKLRESPIEGGGKMYYRVIQIDDITFSIAFDSKEDAMMRFEDE